MAESKRILIVEDEKAIAQALQLKLQHEGFTADIAGNGEEGVKAVEANQYDMILLDLVMPVMDGFELLEAIKDTSAPKYVLSNLSQKEDEQKAKELGAAGFFIKSNTPLNDIVGEIKRILNV